MCEATCISNIMPYTRPVMRCSYRDVRRPPQCHHLSSGLCLQTSAATEPESSSPAAAPALFPDAATMLPFDSLRPCYTGPARTGLGVVALYTTPTHPSTILAQQVAV